MYKKEYLLGELFCGPGGMALGAKMAIKQLEKEGLNSVDIKHSWGVDKDLDAITTYSANDLGLGIVKDAMEFTSLDQITEYHVSMFPNTNALMFGFPCNDYSLVGKQRGANGKYGTLYRAGVNALNILNPEWFIAENVSGIKSANSGQAFKNILSELENSGACGYNMTVHLYKFEDYGVPQYRHRYIIVGIRKDLNKKYKVPAPTHIGCHITVGDVLSEGMEESVKNSELTNQSKVVIDRLLFTPPWKNAWFLDELMLLDNDKRRDILLQYPWYEEQLSKYSDEEISSLLWNSRLNCTKARMSHIYRRLDRNKPSYTITGSGGGGTHVYHWCEPRSLTNRERARLQGFPDDFVFLGSKEQVRKQIGMAVPPIGAKIIFEAILKTMLDIEYESVEPSYSTVSHRA